ncbi:MAG: hypothetical protein LH702_34400 [Phormidesmis sp. CAN_BIN44]|nr:hypothetical protein [Phormidesmis sp. CAN_BIN44]
MTTNKQILKTQPLGSLQIGEAITAIVYRCSTICDRSQADTSCRPS